MFIRGQLHNCCTFISFLKLCSDIFVSDVYSSCYSLDFYQILLNYSIRPSVYVLWGSTSKWLYFYLALIFYSILIYLVRCLFIFVFIELSPILLNYSIRPSVCVHERFSFIIGICCSLNLPLGWMVKILQCFEHHLCLSL